MSIRSSFICARGDITSRLWLFSVGEPANSLNVAATKPISLLDITQIRELSELELKDIHKLDFRSVISRKAAYKQSYGSAAGFDSAGTCKKFFPYFELDYDGNTILFESGYLVQGDFRERFRFGEPVVSASGGLLGFAVGGSHDYVYVLSLKPILKSGYIVITQTNYLDSIIAPNEISDEPFFPGDIDALARAPMRTSPLKFGPAPKREAG